MAGPIPIPNAQKPKVLIVDDESQILMLLKATLERSGFTVAATSDPRRVQEMALREHPVLVISDLMMPGLDGYGVAELLRKDPRTSTIPIAFLTAAPTQANLPKAFSHGVVGYFEKPFHPAKLGQQIQRLLDSVSTGSNKTYGSFRNTPLSELLKAVALQKRTSVLTLLGERKGQVVFRSGSVVDASFESKRSQAAVDAIAMLTEGEFELSGIDGAAEEIIELQTIDVEPITDTQNTDTHEPLPLDAGALEQVERVLVIDDDDVIAKILQKGLEHAHFDVARAANGAEGLSKAVDLRPDLILCDIMMPEMDGWQLFHRLRSDYRINETRFIFLSCYTGFEDRLKALGVQAEAYMAKGILLSQVVQRIHQILEPRRSFRHMAEQGFTGEYQGRIAPLGMKFALNVLAHAHASGTLRVENVWHKLVLDVTKGEPIRCTDEGLVKLDDFNAFLQICGQTMGEITFTPDTPKPNQTPIASMHEWLLKAEEHLTVHEQRVIDTQLVTAPTLRSDPALLEFYMQVAPDRILPILQAVKNRLAPREIMSQIDMSPLEIEEVLKDLVRKRIVLFEPPNS